MDSTDSAYKTYAISDLTQNVVRWLSSSVSESEHHNISDYIWINILAISHLCENLNEKKLYGVDAIIERIIDKKIQLKWTSADLLTSLIALSYLADKECALIYNNDYIDILRSITPGTINSPNDALLFLAFHGKVASLDNQFLFGKKEMGDFFSYKSIDALDERLSYLEASTLFGTLDSENSNPQPPCLLSGAMIYSFKNYDLPRGFRLLRAMKYLGERGAGVNQALNFMTKLQCCDGSFGEYDSAIEKMKLHARSYSDTMAIKYTVTLQALWTFMEFTHTRQSSLSVLLEPLRHYCQERG
ncbi:hypothetical protein [Pectobacterium zantedeschiae]|uniref:Uncharacterized protein n=1 Tax=Pectobacterium zantedeschiae TaxID=2034769 RepID=A0A9X8P711_9GAMM|nr:hypothetical protein [Pectobacterium zantedeschiae]RYC37483.1 hypothetical protein CTN06_21560 [Pectobacterium zantedeschiae]RYC45970.1 hypothetical protein CLR69_13730 [Pectobacterium zantedeschiae]